MPTYSIIMTTVGLNKQAAWEAGGAEIALTELAVGDSNSVYYEPDPTQTTLVNETWRGTVSRVYRHLTLLNRVVVEVTIPADVGGWNVREIGIFDSAGDLILVGKYPLTHKPASGDGAEKELTIQVVKELTNTAAVTLTVDSTAFAMQQTLQEGDWKNSVRAATTGNIALSGLQTIDGVELVNNDAVLVKNQETGSQNGIYQAQSGSWIRRNDADENSKVTANLTVTVEEGTENGNTGWMLTTNNPVVLGTTALEFIKTYPILTAPTQPQEDSSTKLATTEFVKNAINNIPKPIKYLDSAATLIAGITYNVDSSAGALNLTLPASPTLGDSITLFDAKNSWETHNVTLLRNGKNIMGQTADLIVNVGDVEFTIWYNGTEWRLV